jgi:deazaflavin-dependent oxidoreductase (nitroreductase family)
MVERSADSGAVFPGSNWGMLDQRMHRIFEYVNRYWWVPILRLGLAPLFVTPFSGYVMLLRTVGRTTGQVRSAPLNYAIADGCVYCIAGFGPNAHWYRNILVNPNVEVVLPGGALAGVAEPVTDEAEWVPMLRKVLIAGGFAGLGLGVNPRTASDEMLRERGASMPMVRIRPVGVGMGAFDPGGRGWIPAQVVLNVAGFLVARAAWRMVRGLAARCCGR